MMRSLDDGMGRILHALRDARLERDTFLVFTSDNGGERESSLREEFLRWTGQMLPRQPATASNR